jgi:hypothetical protein
MAGVMSGFTQPEESAVNSTLGQKDNSQGKKHQSKGIPVKIIMA